MNGNRKRFLELVSKEETKTAEKNRKRIEKRAMLRASGDIAFKILEKLDELGWAQKQLAEALDVSPQYVSKMVKGNENFTLETLVKLQGILDIPILASYYEKNVEKMAEFIGEQKTTSPEVLALEYLRKEIKTETAYVTTEAFTYKYAG